LVLAKEIGGKFNKYDKKGSKNLQNMKFALELGNILTGQ